MSLSAVTLLGGLLGEPEADAFVGTATQSVLAVEPIAPAVPELARHAVHASAPAAALKVSAAHLVTDVPEPVWPGSATQALTAVEPFRPAVFELTGHSVQEIAPTADMNFPAAHSIQAAPLAELWPAAQLVQALPPVEVLPAAQ